MTHKKEKNDLMKRLGVVWERGRLYASHRSGCVIMLTTSALLTVVFFLDWQFDLEGGVRLSLLGISMFIIVLLAYLIWWRYRRPFDPVKCALEVERIHPEFGGLLVSYVQCRGDAIAHGEASPSLVAAMRKQAEERSRKLSFQGTVRFGTLWKLYLAVIITCMVVIAAAINQPRFAQTYVARILDPFSEIRYPTRTVLDETSGELVVQQGQPVLLRVVVSGKLPEEIEVRFQQQGGAEDGIRVANHKSAGRGHRVFEHEIKDVQRDFNYSILAGDAVSQTYPVRVVRRPDQHVEAKVIYPSYLMREPETAPIQSFEAPLGSTIEWKLSVDRPMSKGRMIFEDETSVPIKMNEGNFSGTLLLTPKDSFTYGLEWTDEETAFVFEPSVRYPVLMVPDQAPIIVLNPGPNEEKATVWKVVDLAFTATDDHGLASASLVYTVARTGRESWNPNEMTEEILVFPTQTTETTENLKWSLKDSIPDLAPGDEVSYAVEILDLQPAPDGPGVGRSETRRIMVVTQEEYAAIATEKRRRLLARIKNLLAEEVKADKEIRYLLEKSAEKTPETR